jgi:hypothetical protein
MAETLVASDPTTLQPQPVLGTRLTQVEQAAVLTEHDAAWQALADQVPVPQPPLSAEPQAALRASYDTLSEDW